jgi:hypothetical protein
MENSFRGDGVEMALKSFAERHLDPKEHHSLVLLTPKRVSPAEFEYDSLVLPADPLEPSSKSTFSFQHHGAARFEGSASILMLRGAPDDIISASGFDEQDFCSLLVVMDDPWSEPRVIHHTCRPLGIEKEVGELVASLRAYYAGCASELIHKAREAAPAYNSLVLKRTREGSHSYEGDLHSLSGTAQGENIPADRVGSPEGMTGESREL